MLFKGKGQIDPDYRKISLKIRTINEDALKLKRRIMSILQLGKVGTFFAVSRIQRCHSYLDWQRRIGQAERRKGAESGLSGQKLK